VNLDQIDASVFFLGRKAKAKELIRRALLRRERGWSQLLEETGLAKGALSMNLRQLQKDKEVVFEPQGRTKLYRLSERGLVRASVSALSKGVGGQISHVLEKMGRKNPEGIRGWLKDGKNLSLEIEDPSLGKVKLTLHPNKQTE
jgi:DNA-binding transcriptional ArsR family regulator